MPMTPLRTLVLAGLLALGGARADAQQLPFPAAAVEDSAVLDRAMPALARSVLARYQADDRDTHLNSTFRLQMVAGEYAAALETLAQLRALRSTGDPIYAPAEYTQYEIYARTMQRAGGVERFAAAFPAAFRETYGRLEERTAMRVDGSFAFPLETARAELRRQLERHAGRDSISLADAVALGRGWFVYDAYRRLVPLAPPLLAAERERRYEIDEDVRVRTRDGAEIAAMVVRPRRLSGPQPAVLVFTMYADEGNLTRALEVAAHGYVGVVANVRGKRTGAVPVVPYAHDGDDAYDVIDWISRQPWSDGRVGMRGGSYDGFVQWSATRRMHPALRTIVPAVAIVPGHDTPMEHGIFQSFQYPWIPYVTNTPLLDDAAYGDRARWDSLDARWFASGAAYRTLDRIDGVPNPIFQEWMDHPAYDAFWSRLVPQGEAYARIDIPVLTITGYFDGAQIGAMHYHRQHHRHNPEANHYLLIGPWEHFGAQGLPSPVVAGYRIDPSARVDVTSLIYQWFDHVFRDAPRPALLADRVNWQVMGTDAWRHAPSLAAMAPDTLTFYLDTTTAGGRRTLAARPGSGSVAQTVDLADRTVTTQNFIRVPLADSVLDVANGVAYVSAPLAEAVTVSGSFLGELHLAISKRDADLGVVLYEHTPDGQYFQLSFYLGRASWTRDPARPRLLTPGAVESIPFSDTRMIAKRIEAGSRLVVVVNVNKSPGSPINYGTGRNVNDETVADAGDPLRLQWHATSFIRIPITR